MYDYAFINFNKEVILMNLEKALKDYRISLWFCWFPIIPIVLDTEEGFCFYFKCVVGMEFYNIIIAELRKDKIEAKNDNCYWYPCYNEKLKFFIKPFNYRIENLKKTINRLKIEIKDKK